MADDKEREPTDGLDSASADPTGADLVAAASDNSRIQLGPPADEAQSAHSQTDETETFEPEPDPVIGDPDSDDPDSGDGDDVPDELREDREETSGGEIDELVPVGAPASGSPARGRSRGSAALSPRPKKNEVTPRQNRPADKAPRTGPVTFVNESVGELRKVVYPTGQQLLRYFVVVLIFVLFIIGIVTLLDLAFGWAIFQIFS
jgi:preprotein translocase subunit SecE